MRGQTIFAAGMSLLLTACSAPSDQHAGGAACAISDEQVSKFVSIPAGTFIKGKDGIYPEEAPEIRLQVSGFSIQTHEVTNAQFAAFVEATEYETDAERSVREARPGAGSAVFRLDVDANAEPPWTLVTDANWRSPEGQSSTIRARAHHPVVHVSQNDARAYAAWAGGRLPSEVEWEYAASLGLSDADDQSSGAYRRDSPRANVWQGIFPLADTGEDGFSGTAPVGCFDVDRIGLYDMIGNVWEWTETPYAQGTHTIKGGSFLCADNFCRRYRPAARQAQETDFSTNHIGFRIVRDPPT